MVSASLDAIARTLETRLQDSTVQRDVSLAPYTTYKVGGRARVFLTVASLRDLETVGDVVAATREHHEPPNTLVIGKGSNLLVSDAGFAGLAIRLGEAFATVTTSGTGIEVGAAAPLPVVARQSVAAGLAGFEWAVGVPGSVGGAIRMNAGGHGSDMAASVRVARVLDLWEGAVGDLGAPDLEFRYRGSAISSHLVVVAAGLDLVPGDPAVGQELVSEIVRWRRQHQPGGQNAGSVFTNPAGDSAGRLIDAAGLKGLRVGTAEVSTKHANFIQCDPEGSADDVRALMDEIIRRVADHGGVMLHPETVMVGFE